MDGTIIQQGKITQPATAVPQTIPLRSGIDWMRVINYTRAATIANDTGYEFYWQAGMPQGGGIVYECVVAATPTVKTAVIASGSGFFYQDTSTTPFGTLYAITGAIASPGVFLTATTTGISATANTSVVRLTSLTGGTSLSGYDFSVSAVNPGVSFTVDANHLPGGIAETITGGNYQLVNWDPIYYPRWRYVTGVSQATNAVVNFSVTHGFTVGQVLRMSIPDSFGMTQLSELAVTVLAVNTTTNTITIDVDTSAFTAFTLPTTISQPFTPAIAAPIGENISQGINPVATTTYMPHDLLDATVNIGAINMYLPIGALAPAGQANDVLYWMAGKSFNV